MSTMVRRAALPTDVDKLKTRASGQPVNFYEFLTGAEITAAKAYNFAAGDLSSKLTLAAAQCLTAGRNLEIPAGGYSGHMTLPGSLSPDTRAKSLRVFGQGVGIPYALFNNGGTVLKSVIDAPVVVDQVVALPQSLIEIELDHLRIDSNGVNPGLLLHSLYGNSSVHHCVFYQRGTGDGARFEYIVTAQVHANYAINRDFVTPGLGASRVGVGFNFTQGYGGGLACVHHNSSRGFLTGYVVGGSATAGAENYSPELHHNEASSVFNGMQITADVNQAWVHHNYFEGCEGGIGIENNSDFTSIEKNLIFAGPGFSVGIKDTSTTNGGTNIRGNTVNTGAVVSAIGIDVASSAAFGGEDKVVEGNNLIYALGTAGVSGIRISGTEPRISHFGNRFVPRGGWTGAGTKEISDQSAGGVAGFGEQFIGTRKAPVVSNGVFNWRKNPTALTQANVAANLLTVGPGNRHDMTATAAVTVNQVKCTMQDGATDTTPSRQIVIYTTNTNTTFQDSGALQLVGNVSFTGPGLLVLDVDYIGGNFYAREISRSAL